MYYSYAYMRINIQNPNGFLTMLIYCYCYTNLSNTLMYDGLWVMVSVRFAKTPNTKTDEKENENNGEM